MYSKFRTEWIEEKTNESERPKNKNSKKNWLIRISNNIETLSDFLLFLQSGYFEKLVAMNNFFESMEIPDDPDFPSIINDKKEL